MSEKPSQEDEHGEGNGHVESAWRTSVHADERDPQLHRALTLVCERHACRGGTCPDRRRRFRNVQAVSGQESAPNAFEGAGSVILTADRRFLFATNGGDNSVSSFTVDKDGRVTPSSVWRL